MLYVILFVLVLLFCPIEFALIFMIGGFFVFRGLSRRRDAKDNTNQGVPSFDPSPSTKKKDIDFDDELEEYETEVFDDEENDEEEKEQRLSGESEESNDHDRDDDD